VANASGAKVPSKSQRHSLKLGKKRRKSSKRNYYIISPRVIIKAIIIKVEASKAELPSQANLLNWAKVVLGCRFTG